MAEQIIDVDLQPSQASYKSFETFFKKIENNEFDVKADFSGAEKEAKEFVKETEKVIENGLGDSLKAFQNESKGIFAKISDSVKGNFDNIISGFAGGAGFGLVQQGFEIVAGSVGDAYTAANEFNNALLDIQAKTGATASEMVGLEEAAKSAFLGGVGESLAEATKTIGEAQTLLGNTFQGAELGDFTAKAQALGNLFDKDVNEVISKATPFIKQFGLSSDEAFNLLAKGLREGKTPSDDLLDTFAEYSQLAANAGFSAAQFTGVLTNGAQEGIFNLDKLADAIKETEIRLKAGDIAKGLGEIGGSNELENNLINQIKAIEAAGASGTKTVQEVLQQSTDLINKALLEENISEQLASQLQVAIAGTPAEDIGTELFGKIFSAPLDEAAINASAATIGEEISNAVGQYNPFDQLIRQAELFITTFGKDVLNIASSVFLSVADAIGFVAGIIQNVISSIVNSPFAALIGEIFDNLKNTINEIIPSFDELKNSFNNALIVVGQLTPIIGGLVAGFAAYQIAVNAAAIKTEFFAIVSKAAGIAQAVYNGAIALSTTIMGGLTAAINFLSSGQVIATAKTYIFAAAQAALNAILNLNPIGLIVTALGALVAGLIYAYKQSEDFRKIIDTLYKKAIKPLVDALFDGAKAVLRFFGLLSDDKKDKTKQFKEIKEAEDEVVESTEKANEEIPKFDDNLKKLGNTTKQTAKETKELTFNDIVNQLALLSLQGKQSSQQYIDLTNKAAKLKISENELKDALQDVNKELDQFVKVATAFDKGINIINTSNEQFKNAVKEAKQNIKDINVLQTGFATIQEPILDDLSTFSETVILTNEEIINSIRNIGGEYAEFYADLNQNILKTSELISSGSASWEDYGKVVANVFGDAAQLAGENVELQRALSATQAIINTAVAVTMAYKELGPILGIPAGIAIAALGALQVAKIYGAEDGVIGLDGSYNKKPGKTDTLPFLLAPGESVINSKATSINKPFLEYANKGGDLGSLFGGMASKIDITNERLVNLEKAMYKAKFSKQSFNLVVENKNNSKISGAVRV